MKKELFTLLVVVVLRLHSYMKKARETGHCLAGLLLWHTELLFAAAELS